MTLARPASALACSLLLPLASLLAASPGPKREPRPEAGQGPAEATNQHHNTGPKAN